MLPSPVLHTMAALLTIAIFSFLYRDNPVYKFAEHIFVGIAAGYIVAIEFQNVFLPNLWRPLLAGDYKLVIPFLLGVLMFSRFTVRFNWLSRWAIGLMVGTFSGLAIIGFAQGDLVAQIQANMLPLKAGSLIDTFTNWVIVVGVLATLVYFFFSKEHKGALGATAKLGIWFLMVSFGASYGFTVMARISLLVGRLLFLLVDWPASLGIELIR
ncbi:MAG: hypothetical protein JSW03_08345 [Candidatus Eiseniibacteriota bacterium]|nr:MAG: hypothetical protein JSW03_08345 [Candidatus Eisenbacteria bacterium]